MNEKLHRGKWKSEAAERRFRELEAELWEHHGDPRPEATDVDTRFGPTRVYRWAGTGDPVVFLHGMGDLSVRWVSYARALPGRDMYAFDLMGDVGNSRHDVGFASTDDYGVWLNEAMDEVGLERAHIVGMSLGGYVALQLAAQFPERVSSLVLLDPVGISKIRVASFIAWGVKCALAAMAPEPMRRRMARRLHQPVLEDKVETAVLLHGQRNHPMAIRVDDTLSDDALRSITQPVTIVLGEESEAFDPHAVVDRATSLLPDVRTDIVPDAGHAVGASHQERCISHVRATELI